MMFAILATVALLAHCAPIGEPPVRKCFDEYVRVLNGHDVEQTMRFYTDDISLNYDGQPNGRTRADLRRFREWEGVMHARFDHRIVSADGDAVVVEMIEYNDLNRALGAKRPVLSEYRFRNRQIYWINIRSVTDLGKPLPGELRKLERWLSAKSPEQTAGLLEDGELIYTAAAARKLLPFLKEWSALPVNSQKQP